MDRPATDVIPLGTDPLTVRSEAGWYWNVVSEYSKRICYNIFMLIDTHCHLHDPEWFTKDEQHEFLQKAHENNVEKMICIGTNHEDSLVARDFAQKHTNVYWTYGIHPEFATGTTTNLMGTEADHYAFLETIRSATSEGEAASARNDGPEERRVSKKYSGQQWLASDKLCAIGEIGLDYHYDGYDRLAQIKLFEQMLQLALDYNLPVSLHLREAFDDAFAVLDNFPQTRGVVHSFTGSKRDLKQALARDFYIGVNGLATYTTPALPPLERIVLETDAPFLTPAPYRNEKNGPQFIKNIAEYLAEKFQTPLEEVAKITTQNAERIFKI